METIVITLIVVSGFLTISYLHNRHIAKLELLIKGISLDEVKRYEEKKKEKILPNIPEEIQEATQDMKPDEIRGMFRN